LWALPGQARREHLQQREGRRHALRPFTSQTVVSQEALSRELVELARTGVFIEQEQYRDNVCCSAILVRNDESSGAIAMPYPLERWQKMQGLMTSQLRRVGADLRRQFDPHRGLAGGDGSTVTRAAAGSESQRATG
jgi:DNA-binding IclR family transcriptional regulator